MSGSGRRPRWQLHATLIAGLALCALGFWVELGRGLAGHLPAWVYVVEWPFFAVCGVILWLRLLRDEQVPQQPRPTAPSPPTATDDAELAAWQAYVTRFESAEQARRLIDGDEGPVS